MVTSLRKALAGFILLPGKPPVNAPETPYVPEETISKACAVRGLSDKDKSLALYLLEGRDESDVLRNLREVLVEGTAPLKKGRNTEGLNLCVFRGVFGCGGYSVDLRSVRCVNGVIEIECDFEEPGEGIRTTAGFTQPASIVRLKGLPQGKYQAKLFVRSLQRSSAGVKELKPRAELTQTTFTVLD